MGGGLRQPQDSQGLGQETAPGGGEADRAAGPVEELDVEDAFQHLDLPRERRLRHVQPGGGTPEMQFLRDGGKAAELTEIEHHASHSDGRGRMPTATVPFQRACAAISAAPPV